MTFDPSELVNLARTRVGVTRLGFGGASIGGLFETAVEGESLETIDRAWKLGLRYFDTAPFYGYGLSERLLGRALADRPRRDYVLSTKVGRILRPVDLNAAAEADVFAGHFEYTAVYDFSRPGIDRSIAGSLERLGLDRIDIAFIHDPDDHWPAAIDSAYPRLHQLRKDGVVGAIGVGMNQAPMLAKFVRETDIDVVLCAGRYTLLDQAALADLLPACTERSVSVVIGGVLNSGLLANPEPGSYFDYAPASRERIAQALRLKEVCDRHGVSLKAAAIQFPMAHPAVVSVLGGVRRADHLSELDTFARTAIPPGMWDELRHEGLIPPAAPTPV